MVAGKREGYKRVRLAAAVVYILLFLIAGLLRPACVWAQEDTWDVDFSPMDEAVKEAGLEYESFREYVEAVLGGEETFSFSRALSLSCGQALADLRQEKQLFLQLLSLLLLLLFLKYMSAGPIASYALILLLIRTGLQCFRIPYTILCDLTERVQTVGQAEIPVLAAVTLASGRFRAATMQSELMLMGLNALLFLVRRIFLPLVHAVVLLEAIGAMADDEWSAGLSGFLRLFVSKGMKAVTAVLLFLLSMRAQLAGISDQWVRKAASAALSSVPVVGKSLSGAVDTVVSSSKLLLKTVGLLGLVLILLICLLPVLKMLLLWLLFSLASSFLKPLAGKGGGRLIAGLVNGISLMIGLMSGVLIAYLGMTLIFILSVGGG